MAHMHPTLPVSYYKRLGKIFKNQHPFGEMPNNPTCTFVKPMVQLVGENKCPVVRHVHFSGGAPFRRTRCHPHDLGPKEGMLYLQTQKPIEALHT